MTDLFKIQYRGVYLEVEVNNEFVEYVNDIIEWLTFLKENIKQPKSKEPPCERCPTTDCEDCPEEKEDSAK